MKYNKLALEVYKINNMCTCYILTSLLYSGLNITRRQPRSKYNSCIILFSTNYFSFPPKWPRPFPNFTLSH